MALVFTPEASLPGSIQSMGSLYALAGTLTVSGSYATGGDTFAAGQDLESLLKKTGKGKVIHIDCGRGLNAEWDSTAKKLKLFVSGATEMTAAAYAAGYTASPIPCLVFGR